MSHHVLLHPLAYSCYLLLSAALGSHHVFMLVAAAAGQQQSHMTATPFTWRPESVVTWPCCVACSAAAPLLLVMYYSIEAEVLADPCRTVAMYHPPFCYFVSVAMLPHGRWSAIRSLFPPHWAVLVCKELVCCCRRCCDWAADHSMLATTTWPTAVFTLQKTTNNMANYSLLSSRKILYILIAIFCKHWYFSLWLEP